MSGAASIRLESNRALVERIRAGDESAFEALFHAYHAPLCTFACRFVDSRDIAEEIVQEVFLFIWERRETWEIRDSVTTYLFAAVHNAAASFLRHERVVRRHEAESIPLLMDEMQRTETTDEQVRHNELTHAVRRAIAELPARCQAVFTLSREQGLTYSQIATVLGIAPKTVEIHMGRALRKLREALAAFR